MMGTICVHREVARRPRLFPGVKARTIPDQAMSIKEMFRRFVRREPLPLERDGVYVESEYDLEKISHMDTIEKREILEEMREKVSAKDAKVKRAQKEKEEKEKALADAVASVEQKDPKGGEPIKNPTPKGS